MNNNTVHIERAQKAASVAHLLDMKNITIISGRPGQGKTTFAVSIAEKYYKSHIYYKITEQDKIPEHFCAGLYRLFIETFPKYSCSEFKSVMDENRFDPLEADSYLRSILRSLKKILTAKTVIILDDVHTLPDIGIACSATLSGLTLSGGMLNFIICSRRNCKFPDAFLRLNKISQRTVPDFLNVTEHEFAELAVKMLADIEVFSKMPLIMGMTEGWITGVIKIFEHISKTGSSAGVTKDSLPALFGGYFQSVVSAYPVRHIKDIMLLSLLDYFDVNMIQALDPSGKMTGEIHEMLYRNTFTQMNGSSIRFHNMFKMWLRNAAYTECSESEKETLYKIAADYEFSRQNSIKGFEYLIRSGLAESIETYIRNNYQMIVTSDSPKIIYNALMSLSAESLRDNPWTSLLFGHFCMLNSPEAAEELLNVVFEKFSSSKDKIGILLSAELLLCYYADVKGSLKEAAAYYTLICRLYETCDLTGYEIVADTGYAIAGLYLGSPSDVLPVISGLLSRSEKDTGSVINILAYRTGIKCAIYIADRATAERYCDSLILKLSTCSLNGAQKLAMLVSLGYYSSACGAYETVDAMHNMMFRRIRLHTEDSPKSMVLIKISALNKALCTGKYKHAYNLMRTVPHISGTSLPPHLRSVYALFNAMTAAVMCDRTAGQMAEDALALRDDIPCSPYFQTLAVYMTGAVFSMLGNFRKSEGYLHRAMADAEDYGLDMIAAACNAYLSYLHNSVGDRITAHDFAVTAVRMMQKTDLNCFTVLIPDVTLNMCQYAVSDRSVKQYAAEIAFERCNTAFDKTMRPIPVLNINVLGELSMSAGHETSSCDGMTSSFRQMLAILLSSRGYSIEQETIQAYMWPESSKDQARRSFDNLVSRFRKLLAETFDGIEPKNYITLTSGVLRLVNIRCDADVYVSLCRGATECYARGEYRHAADMLIRAESMFCDRFFTEASGVDAIEQKRRDVDACFTSMLKLMQKLDFFLPDVFNPEKFYDRWLDIYMSETDVVLTAYKYYLGKQMTQKARNILHDYQARLKLDGYSDDEITELVFFIKSSAAS